MLIKLEECCYNTKHYKATFYIVPGLGSVGQEVRNKKLKKLKWWYIFDQYA